MLNKIKALKAWLSIKFMTYVSSPDTMKSEMQETLGINKINNTLEDKVMDPIAKNATKVTKFSLKLTIIVFVIHVIALLISSAWSADEITYNGETIKEYNDVED